MKFASFKTNFMLGFGETGTWVAATGRQGSDAAMCGKCILAT